MRLPRRRLRFPRRLPGAPAAPLRPPGADARSHESTAEGAAARDEIPVLPPPGLPVRGPAPRPPQKIAFDCLCGAALVATSEAYDRHTRCAVCQTLLLLSLVYDGDVRSFEIVPFQIEPGTGSERNCR